MLDLRALLNSKEKAVAFGGKYDLVGFSPDIVGGVAEVSGLVTDYSGYIELTADFTLNMRVTCARCAEPFDTALGFSIRHPVAEKLENEEDEDEYVLVADGKLDDTELCRSSIILNLPSRFICRDDCKGLCPECGANLNISACSCGKKKIDPRLAKLQSLLDK